MGERKTPNRPVAAKAVAKRKVSKKPEADGDMEDEMDAFFS